METYIVQFKDGSNAIHKTMEQWDIVGEVGTYETSKIIGWDVVPETIQCDYGKGQGSSQKWISDSNESWDGFDDNQIVLEEKHLNDLSKIFVMDMVIGNFDRHSGNIAIDPNGKCWAIDNEEWSKRNNAKLHIETLKQYAETSEGEFVPMFYVLKESFGNDIQMYKKFKDHVDNSINEMLKHKDEIIKYWLQYEDVKVRRGGTIPAKEAIGYIKRNIKYLEDYEVRND